MTTSGNLRTISGNLRTTSGNLRTTSGNLHAAGPTGSMRRHAPSVRN